MGIIRDVNDVASASRATISAELIALDAPMSGPLDAELRRIATQVERAGEEIGELGAASTRARLEFCLSRLVRLRRAFAGLAELAEIESAGEPALIDAGSALDTAIRRHAAELESSETLVVQDDLPKVWAVPGEVELLLEQLLANSLAYRGDESPLVEVSARREGPWQAIEFADNGRGFDAEYAEVIFEPLVALEGSDTPSGIGLGLSLCRRIAARYGGSIEASSVPGLGSTFTVRLPAGPPMAEASQ